MFVDVIASTTWPVMVTSCYVAKGKLTLNRKPRKPRKAKPELPLSFPEVSLTNQQSASWP